MNKLLLFLLLAGVAQLGAMEGPGGKEEMPLQAEAAQPGQQDVSEFEKLPKDMQFAILEQTKNLDDKIALLKVLQSSGKKWWADEPEKEISFGGETYKGHDAFVKGLTLKIRKAQEELGEELLTAIKNLSENPTKEQQEEVTKKVKELIAKGANLNVAMAKENVDFAELLKQLSDHKEPPLHTAVGKGSKELVQILLEHKANPSAQDIFGKTPLHAAVVKGSKELVQILLEYKANPNAQDPSFSKWTPLHYAVEYGNKKLVQILLEYEADPNMEDTDGKTPFDIAVDEGNQEIIELIKKHMDIGALKEEQ